MAGPRAAFVSPVGILTSTGFLNTIEPGISVTASGNTLTVFLIRTETGIVESLVAKYKLTEDKNKPFGYLFGSTKKFCDKGSVPHKALGPPIAFTAASAAACAAL